MGINKKRRPKVGPFLMLGKDMILECPEWQELSPAAKIAYIYIRARHNGSNNGDISMPYSEFAHVKGLGSPSTISRALVELEKGGWIRKAHHGGLMRYRNKFELTGRHDNHIIDRGLGTPPKYITSTFFGSSASVQMKSEPTIQRNNIGDRAAPSSTPPPEDVASPSKTDS